MEKNISFDTTLALLELLSAIKSTYNHIDTLIGEQTSDYAHVALVDIQYILIEKAREVLCTIGSGKSSG